MSHWLHPVLILVEESQIILQEADLPDFVVDLAHAHELAGEDVAEVDLAPAEADATATGDADGAVVERVVRVGRGLVDPG